MTNHIQSVLRGVPSSTLVVAVTKTFPFDAVSLAYRHGIRHVGENRVEEAKQKIEQAQTLGLTDMVWHMIGHVQSRRVPQVVSLFEWVDSVDSVELMQRIDHAAGKLGKRMHILFEVNVSGEKSKFGFEPWQMPDVVKKSAACRNLAVEGYMTMAPFVVNAEENRVYFQALRELLKTIREHYSFVGPHLSMGTSCDYKVAIEEGATQVRLGEALYGKRKPTG